MIVNYEDTMREISFILEKCKCNVDDDKAIFAVEDKDFAKLCDLMVSMQGTVDVPFKCTAGDKKYTVNEWEITFVETSKELYTKRDVYLIHIIGKFYQNIYEDGVDYPIFQFEDGELAILDSQGYSIEVVTYNPIHVRLYSPKHCDDCNNCYTVFNTYCKKPGTKSKKISGSDVSCDDFEEKKKCEDCEGYCPSKHPDSLGACRKHEFRSCSGNRERCYDFVDKHTYFLCKHYRGDGDGEYEFCIKENVTGRLCSMQSTCPHFEKAYVPSNKDWTKCDALVSMGDEQTYFCRRCGGVGAYCKKENCSSVMEKIS